MLCAREVQLVVRASDESPPLGNGDEAMIEYDTTLPFPCAVLDHVCFGPIPRYLAHLASLSYDTGEYFLRLGSCTHV